MLCEFSKDLSQGLESKLWCNILNQPCGYYRFCTSKKCIVMLESYKNCPKRGEQMGRPKKSEIETNINAETIEQESPSPIEPETEHEATASPIIEEKPKKEKIKTYKIICEVLHKTPTKFAISIFGDGILLNDKSAIKTDKVEITYSGQYPESFEIVSYKFI
jgi:hypothetical protein